MYITNYSVTICHVISCSLVYNDILPHKLQNTFHSNQPPLHEDSFKKSAEPQIAKR